MIISFRLSASAKEVLVHNFAWLCKPSNGSAAVCISCIGFHQFYYMFCLHIVSDLQETSYLWRTSLYLAASASAEFIADIALCPMEAVKVRIQTQPGWANTLREGLPKLYAEEGMWG
jgi:Mitochondrial carrier protein